MILTPHEFHLLCRPARQELSHDRELLWNGTVCGKCEHHAAMNGGEMNYFMHLDLCTTMCLSL